MGVKGVRGPSTAAVAEPKAVEKKWARGGSVLACTVKIGFKKR